jgi:hypothetical protein
MTDANTTVADAAIDNEWACVRCGSEVENPFDELCAACREPSDGEYQPLEDWEMDGGGK